MLYPRQHGPVQPPRNEKNTSWVMPTYEKYIHAEIELKFRESLLLNVYKAYRLLNEHKTFVQRITAYSRRITSVLDL